METVIDSLVVKLRLDTKEFKNGINQVSNELDKAKNDAEKAGNSVEKSGINWSKFFSETLSSAKSFFAKVNGGWKSILESFNKLKNRAEETGKSIQSSGKKGADFFGQIRAAALKFFAVLTVGRGMSDFTRSVVQGGAQLARMSDRLGLSADTLSRWQGAVRQSGGSAEGLLGTMQSLSSSLTELQLTGNTGILPYLQALGVAVADASGKARPLDEILADIGDKLNAMPNRESAYNIGRNLGIDEGTVNLLMKGREEVNRLLAAQQAFSDADAKAALQASEKWEQVKLRIERTTQELVIKLLPSLEKLAESMANFAEVAVPVLAGAIDWFVKLDEATNGWATTLGIALAALRLITGPAIIGGIGGLLTALTKLSLIGAAGAAGWAVGSEINEKFVQGTEAGDTVGRSVAKVLAFFGNDEAQEALDTEERAEKQTRAQRNNNPGNLEFRGQNGAAKEKGEGRFAKFNTAGEGVAALVRQLKKYGERGLDTIREIITTYAPSNENDTKAYIASLSKKLGVGADAQLNLGDSDTLAGLVRGISQHEGGNWLRDKDILSGLQIAGVSPPQQQAPNMSIGEIKVYTQANDAQGIARDIGGALIRQADTGMR